MRTLPNSSNSDTIMARNEKPTPTWNHTCSCRRNLRDVGHALRGSIGMSLRCHPSVESSRVALRCVPRTQSHKVSIVRRGLPFDVAQRYRQARDFKEAIDDCRSSPLVTHTRDCVHPPCNQPGSHTASQPRSSANLCEFEQEEEHQPCCRGVKYSRQQGHVCVCVCDSGVRVVVARL